MVPRLGTCRGRRPIRRRQGQRPDRDRGVFHPHRAAARQTNHQRSCPQLCRRGRKRRHRTHPRLVARHPGVHLLLDGDSMDDSHGVPEVLIYGFPTICRDGNPSSVQGLENDAFSRSKMDANANELSNEADAVAEIFFWGGRSSLRRKPAPERASMLLGCGQAPLLRPRFLTVLL